MNFNELKERAGIVIMGVDRPIAMDAQAPLTTTPNGGIPALFTTYQDPRVIETVLAPVRMAEIFSERKMGTAITPNAIFTRVENTGTIATYGDFDNNGTASANTSFPQRDHYYYQTNITIGDLEIEQYQAANLDWVSRKQQSAAMALNRFQNKTYIYGVSGMKLYGMLNDPNLIAPLNLNVPNLGSMTAEDMFNQVFRPIYNQLVKQTVGNINAYTPMKLLLSPQFQTNLQNTNQFGKSLQTLLSENYPNLTIEVIPEYGQGTGGENVQWLVEEFEGMKTVELGFTEKMRVHAMDRETSGWKQKRSQGSLGAVVFAPTFVSSAIVGTASA